MAVTAPIASGADGAPASLREAWPVFLRHPSPRLLLCALALTVAGRAFLGGFGSVDLVPVAIVALWWPIQEWLIHVFILHYRPRQWAGRTWDFPVPRKHRAHHRDPWNLDLVFIPMHSYLYSLPILVVLCGVVAPNPRLALDAVIAVVLATLHYEAVHFLVHTRVTPRTAFYRRLWRNHRLHHFKNEHYWFGVTRLEADRWLRTAPAPGDVPLSGTARSIGGTGSTI